ncbi:MAG TPA: DUF6526 family protein [Vicinamibacterales bacterium]|nr:DUF6526 family protein [Vicinamibacterales bacterium]
MADREQNYKNHTRVFPLFHYVALPILFGNFLVSVWHLWVTPNASTVWSTIVAFGLVALGLSSRVMAVTVQDRVIRLEMQLRLMRVLPPDMQGRIASLGRAHFVALRFAADEELPELVREISDGRLRSPKEIKLRVKRWQPDWLRA